MKKKLLPLLIVFTLLFTLMPAQITARAADYTPQADTLNALGLFIGTATGYNLDRDMTRAEAGVMVVRLLGKEAEALKAHWDHPFKDVPVWAGDYIGYLYRNDITRGTSTTRYGSNDKVTPNQYAAFMLRALSYDDAAGDFDWRTALDKMSALGILTAADAAAFGKTAALPRGGAVSISYAALLAKPKGSYYALLQRLYTSDKAISATQMANAARKDAAVAQRAAMLGIPRSDAGGGGSILNAEAVFDAASPAVFYLEVFKADQPDDDPYGSGSGFFITADGAAVTNFHVIEDMSSARAITPDGKTYDVDRVLAYSKEEDIAILQIKGGGFPYLPLGDPAKLRAGQRIYTMGSPLGFDNTISDGLVSSPVKVYPLIDNRMLIQISAPLSYGSSGGALLNQYGEVVGVTTFGTYGQNLNFAVPVTDLCRLAYLDPPRAMSEIASESVLSKPFHYSWADIYDEEEGNDDAPVQTLEDESIYHCGISDKDDIDLFGLLADAARDVHVTWRTKDIAHRDHIRADIVNLSTGAVVSITREMEDVPYLYVEGHLTKGGKYALCVMTDGSPDAVWAETPYEFYVEYTDVPEGQTGLFDYFAVEMKPNGAFDTADHLTFGYTVLGSLDGDEDKAYLRFTLDASTETSIVFMGYDEHSYDIDAVPLKGELYDSSRKLIGSLSPTMAIDSTFKPNTRTLAAGDYYIVITGAPEAAAYFCYAGNLDMENPYW